MIKNKESAYYKELKLTWRRGHWTWERVHTLGRQSLDGGVRTFCERLAANISKGIPLTKHNIQQLDRLNDEH